MDKQEDHKAFFFLYGKDKENERSFMMVRELMKDGDLLTVWLIAFVNAFKTKTYQYHLKNSTQKSMLWNKT